MRPPIVLGDAPETAGSPWLMPPVDPDAEGDPEG